MSANNQILVKEYKGKWYVFDNIMAESWDDKNELSIKDAKAVFNSEENAYDYAEKLEYTEYGIGSELLKDGAEVKINFK